MNASHFPDSLLDIDATGEIFTTQPLDRENISNDGIIVMKVQVSTVMKYFFSVPQEKTKQKCYV